MKTSPLHQLLENIEQARANQQFGDLRSKVLEHREAYSTDIFPDYTLNENPNPSIDQVSGKMGRYMCDVFLKYIDDSQQKQVSSLTPNELMANEHVRKLVADFKKLAGHKFDCKFMANNHECSCGFNFALSPFEGGEG